MKYPLIFGIAPLALGIGCAGSRTDKFENELSDLRNLQAEHTAAIAEIRTELRQLSGKMEEVQHASVGKTQELEATIKQFSARVPPPPGVPEDLLNRDESAIGAHNGPAADQFRTGLQQIRSGDFENAVRTFDTFVQANAGTAFTDNALFWSGVAEESLGRYDRAIVAYSNVFQRFPAEDMAPAALSRLADAFEKIGSRKDVILTLQKLVDEYSRSPYAVAARTKLSQLEPKKKRGR